MKLFKEIPQNAHNSGDYFLQMNFEEIYELFTMVERYHIETGNSEIYDAIKKISNPTYVKKVSIQISQKKPCV